MVGLPLQHEGEDGDAWSDAEPAEDAASSAGLQSQEELRDGPTDITNVTVAWNTIAQCSIIVGMHPDQVFLHC